jgi:hypothetical protein
MRRLGIATAIATTLLSAAPVRAELPVVDFSALGQWAKALQSDARMITNQLQQIAQLAQSVHDFEDIPQNLIGQVVGLLQVGVQNPLQNITANLSALMNGSGVGTCSGANGLLTMNQYAHANGADFAGAWLNGSAAITAGLQACTRLMMQATQDRLSQLPQLLSEVQSCHDQACATALSARIQLETATINTQQQQAQLVMMNGQLQRWTAEDQIMQKQRQDYEAIVNGTGGNAGVTAPVATSPAVSAFSASNFGG